MPDQGSIEQFDRPLAEKLLARVDNLLDKTREAQDELHRNYVEIGIGLLAVQTHKAWMILDGVKTFDQYVMGCQGRFGRKRTALYGYTSVVRELLPSLGPEKLVEMGISRAQSLVPYVQAGHSITPEILQNAAEQGVDEFRTTINGKLHKIPEYVGAWRVIGFYATKEEWDEIERALDIAARTFPPVAPHVPAWVRTKEAIQRMCMDYLAQYEAEVLRSGN